MINHKYGNGIKCTRTTVAIYLSFVVVNNAFNTRDAHNSRLQTWMIIHDQIPAILYSVNALKHIRKSNRVHTIRCLCECSQLIPTTWPVCVVHEIPARAIEPIVGYTANSLLLADTLSYACVVQFPPDRKKGMESGWVCVRLYWYKHYTGVSVVNSRRMNRSWKKRLRGETGVLNTPIQWRRDDLLP